MISKTKHPGICNNCGRKSEFYIRAGVHSMQLCSNCLNKLVCEARTFEYVPDEVSEYNNSVETGLITPKTCSAQTVGKRYPTQTTKVVEVDYTCHKEVENDKRPENN